jgi:two-component system, OmpR family, phosphate regulon sensor histidine kinase PhoR
MRFFTSVHLFLLAYIIAAIVYWGIKLQNQSRGIYVQEVITLKSQVDSASYPVIYNKRLASLKHTLSLRTIQFTGEGSTFLIVILIGAFVVYTSFHRRIMLSRQQNNFMLSVTHELKSPIAAMKLNLQTLEKHMQLDEQKRKELIVRCIKESNRLNDLCNNMLFASQIEGRQYKPAREQVDLSELLEDAVKDYGIRYPRKFERDIQPAAAITGDRVMLQMAVSNLLENTIKYTPDDSTVTTKLFTKQDNIILQIADHGPGIPDSEKKKIFNKFYRVGSEESRKSKGTGLGLYLTNKIVLQHKGRITVKDNAPSGAIFEICLPLV